MSASGSATDVVGEVICKFAELAVCNSDIRGPLARSAASVSKIAAGRSAAQDPVDADRHDGADGNGDDVEIARLVVRIERGEEREADDGAGNGAREHFRDHEHGAPGAAVPFCKVALAAGTGRHSVSMSADFAHTIAHRPRLRWVFPLPSRMMARPFGS